jgi:hypothetical protein
LPQATFGKACLHARLFESKIIQAATPKSMLETGALRG